MCPIFKTVTLFHEYKFRKCYLRIPRGLFQEADTTSHDVYTEGKARDIKRSDLNFPVCISPKSEV